jgi:UDP-2-acetamido-3-amino-2,3-dideoxy-glucuronate N-acetyltransferase
VSVFIHPTAIVDPGAVVGDDCKIWHFSHVMAGARLGAGTTLGQNVFVGGAASVGARCKIANNVSLYDAVSLADDVFVGPSAVFTNVKTPRAFVSRRHDYQPTVVERGASIGANATIVCGRRLGAYCFIGAGAVVTGDVPAYALFVGVPARFGGWVCRCGVKLPDATGDLICASCGDGYQLRDDALNPRGAAPQNATSQSRP